MTINLSPSILYFVSTNEILLDFYRTRHAKYRHFLLMEVQKEATVFEALPSATFRVKMKEGGAEVLAYLAGKMRKNHIRVLPGDRVLVELSPDGRRGRIVRRL